MCFENTMQERKNGCNCPMECSTVSYSFSLVSTKLNEKEMCQNLSKNGQFWTKQFEADAHKDPPQFMRKLLKVRNNVSDDAKEYCRRNIKYRAEVIFRLATDSMSVTVMSSRLSFFDKMSAFGKNASIDAIISY